MNLELIEERKRKAAEKSRRWYWRNREKINAKRKLKSRIEDYKRVLKEVHNKRWRENIKYRERVRFSQRKWDIKRRYHPDLVPIMLELYKAKKQAKEIVGGNKCQHTTSASESSMNR